MGTAQTPTSLLEAKHLSKEFAFNILDYNDTHDMLSHRLGQSYLGCVLTGTLFLSLPEHQLEGTFDVLIVPVHEDATYLVPSDETFLDRHILAIYGSPTQDAILMNVPIRLPFPGDLD